jgi:three-Cys-motif partner protein
VRGPAFWHFQAWIAKRESCAIRCFAASQATLRMRNDTMARKSSEEILAELQAYDDGHLVRPIGIWSLEKLATLLLYFRAFSTACESVGGGYYVDGFAGPGLCRVKNAQPGPYYAWGSPLLALRNSPDFERCILLDIRPRNVEALSSRARPFGQRANIHCGDINLELSRLVRELVPSGAPCFCLLDPQGTELAWSTLVRVSKTPERARKPELLILFPLRMALLRLMTTERAIPPQMMERLDVVFGSQTWSGIHRARLDAHIFAKRSAASLFGRVLQWLAEPGLRMGQIEGYYGPTGTRPAAARNVPPHFRDGSRGWRQDNGRRFPSAVCSRLSSVCAAPSFRVDDRKAIPRPPIELSASPHSPHPIAPLIVHSPLFKEERHASSPRLIAH